VPDRDHHALRLAAVLAAVLSAPGFSQAQEGPSARPEPVVPFRVRRGVRGLLALRRPIRCRCLGVPSLGADPFSSMLHKSLSRNVRDPESMHLFGSLATRSVDPRVESDLLRKCRVVVRERLKGIAPSLRCRSGVEPVNLGSLSLLNPEPAPTGDDTLSSDTAQTAASKAVGRKRYDQWKVSFQLTYQGIPLEKSTTVVILANRDSLED